MNILKKAVSVVVLASSVVGLTACSTTTGYNTSARPAVSGAVAGAAIGALAKSDGDRQDIGKAAAIGAAAGAAGGYILGNTATYPYQR